MLPSNKIGGGVLEENTKVECLPDEVNEEEIKAELETISQQNKRYLKPKEIFAYLLTDFIGGSSYIVNMQFFWMNFFNNPGGQYGRLTLFTGGFDALDDPVSGLII